MVGITVPSSAPQGAALNRRASNRSAGVSPAVRRASSPAAPAQPTPLPIKTLTP
jgi:hypothetical protein